MKTYRIKNILVPLDFSPISRNGLHHAERIARLTHARLTLLNVVEPKSGAAGTSGMLKMSAILDAKLQKENAQKLERMAKAAAKRSRISVAAVSVVGRVGPEVEKMTRRMRSDLIVMGTHGASGFVENLLGSNTYRIASLSKIPLLSVHRKMGRSGYNRIVYPVREQSRALDKIPHTLLFAKLFRAHVHILGLLRPEEKELEKVVRAQCAAIQKRFAAGKVSAQMSFTYDEFFPEAVIRLAHAHSGSLVVTMQDADFHLVEMFQGAFTRRVLHSILSPVLVIPPGRSGRR
jgi:nucleotide-binding universal stress UspA family protein